jgi:hypothetical protein
MSTTTINIQNAAAGPSLSASSAGLTLPKLPKLPKNSGTVLITVGGLFIVAGMQTSAIVRDKKIALVLTVLGWILAIIGLLSSANHGVAAALYSIGLLAVLLGLYASRWLGQRVAQWVFLAGWIMVGVGRMLHENPGYRSWVTAVLPVLVVAGSLFLFSNKKVSPLWMALVASAVGWILMGATTTA